MAALEGHLVDFAVLANLNAQPFRQRVDNADTHAVQPAGDFVDAVVELPARVQMTEDDFQRGDFLGGVGPDRNAHAVVDDGAGFIRMDRDVDVARALDLITEEMTNKNSKTGLPLNVELLLEDGHQVSNSLVATIRVALKHWCVMHKMNIKLFDIARHTLKYGDLFFRKFPKQKT